MHHTILETVGCLLYIYPSTGLGYSNSPTKDHQRFEAIGVESPLYSFFAAWHLWIVHITVSEERRGTTVIGFGLLNASFQNSQKKNYFFVAAHDSNLLSSSFRSSLHTNFA